MRSPFKLIALLLPVLPPFSGMSQTDPFEEALYEVEQNTPGESRFKIGAKAGLVTNSKLGTALNHAATFEMAVYETVSLGSRIDYSSFSRKCGKLSDLSLGGFAKYSFTLSDRRLSPYATVGLANHNFLFSSDLHSRSFSLLGFDLGGGTSYEIANGWALDGSLNLLLVSDLVSERLEIGLTKAF